jgi:pyruvate/2-oxoglutarate dehydrogenase complex dihydrolipoamide acyltransferase (E2) component
VVDAQVVPRRLTEIGITFDHRLVDGAQMAAMIGVVRGAVERPWEVWPEVAPRPD